jgi:sugar lactone lactonase YvrE
MAAAGRRAVTAALVADGLNFPECPRWRDGEIWFVDTPYIKVATVGGHVRNHAMLPDARLVLGLTFAADGAALAGDAPGRRVYRASDSGRVELVADLSRHFEHSTNELIAMPEGSLYVGSMGFDILGGGQPQASRLARVSAAGQIEPAGPEVLFPNGMALSGDNHTLYLAESFASKITTFEVRSDGWLGAASTFADVSGRDVHHPDGLSPDPGGGVWYADPFAGVVVLVAPGGAEIDRRSMPLRHPTSCTVGGSRDELLIVTATPAMAGPDLKFAGGGALFTSTRQRPAGSAGQAGATR